MATTLTSKGQVTIPKRIRDAMQLVPGAPVEFSVNAAGEVVLHPARPAGRARATRPATVSMPFAVGPTCPGGPMP